MKKLWALVFLLGSAIHGGAPSPTNSAKVLWVPLEGTVELGLSPYIIRALDYAESNQFDAMILDVDTFGGRVDAAVQIRDALLDSPVRSVAFVDKRAISAGALISLACEKVYFTPGSTMGAATPIQMSGEGAKPVENKVVSYFRAEMGSTAERRGRDRQIAESMVLATEDIKGLVKANDVLTLTDKTAFETKMADGIATNREDLLNKLGFQNAKVEEFSINWAERLVRFLTDPTVSSLLMSAGILGLIFELQAPGFGLPGIIGIGCLGLFFFGKYFVFLAGWEEFFLIILGIAFIFIEIFVTAGNFIFGTIGGVLLLTALFLSGVSPKIPLDLSFPEIQSQLKSTAWAFIAMCAGFLAILYWISKNPRRLPLSLTTALAKEEGYTSHTDVSKLLGAKGIALTPLRPMGKASFSGETYEVVTEGEFLEKNVEVHVVAVADLRVVVKPINPEKL